VRHQRVGAFKTRSSISEEASARRHLGVGIWDGASGRRHPGGGIWEDYGRDFGRALGGLWEKLCGL